MKTLSTLCTFAVLTVFSACNTERSGIETDGSDVTVASETGSLAADVLYATRPLIGGDVYKSASFQATSLIHFDTTQLIQVLDTTDAVFVRARVQRDTAAYTGFVPKAILPE
jgi:hypothetical protein